MPVDWRLQVLGERLAQDGFDARIETADLYELGRDEIPVVLDAIIATGEGFPVVLVNGSAICVGSIDVELIAAAACG